MRIIFLVLFFLISIAATAQQAPTSAPLSARLNVTELATSTTDTVNVATVDSLSVISAVYVLIDSLLEKLDTLQIQLDDGRVLLTEPINDGHVRGSVISSTTPVAVGITQRTVRARLVAQGGDTMAGQVRIVIQWQLLDN